ncbi:ImmA/IrrE family metallo-endopeptidase [Enterococcus faecalis]|uniref:ImmA/IrrE family metallo-endopeptidase n=1 Tax=Enterococcus faecalis TaxID=1351 RepID=UPI0030D01A5C
MKSIKELVEEYNVELVFTTLHKKACFEPKYGVIFINQDLSTAEQEEAIYHEFKHVKDHADLMALYNIPVFRSKMEAEAEQYMLECLIEKNGGQFNYSNVITHYNLKMGQEIYLK